MSDSTNAQMGKNYAIMRVARIRALGEMRRVEQHNTREKPSENVEPGGPAPRELVPDAHADTLAGARERMAELRLDLGKLKGAVGVEVVLTTSRAWWDIATDEMQQDWIDANLGWLNDKFGRALLSAKLHEDEKTPHIHAIALSAVSKVDGVRGPKPKSEEGRRRREEEQAARAARWRWNYRDLFGQDFEHLSREQDRYHAAVAHLGLDRGERRREVADVVLDNGVVVPAAQVSRGKRRDGSDRPRRTITTQQYQAAAREDRARAAEEMRRAEVARIAAAAIAKEVEKQREAAALIVRRAEEQRASAALATRQAEEKRAEAAEVTRLAEEDRRAAAAERTEADRLAAEQQAAIARQQRDLDDLHAAAKTDRDKAERHRIDAAEGRAAMVAARDRAEAEAALANLKRRDAEVVAATAVAEREAIAATRRDLDERRKIEVAQIALLVRAADDRSGLNLRLAGDSFAIGPYGLTDEDQALKAKGWSRALIAMARGLAQALDRVRTLARDLVRRERAAEQQAADLNARDAALAQDRAVHDARVAAHQRAIADLDQRRTALAVDEARVIAAAAAAAASSRAASAAQVGADTALQDHRRWIEVMDTLETRPDWVEVGPGGALVLNRHAAAVSPALAKTFECQPPAWVVSLAVQRLDLADALQRADDRERGAAYAVERLEAMIARAGPVLTPAQQDAATQAERTIRRYRPHPDGIERER